MAQNIFKFTKKSDNRWDGWGFFDESFGDWGVRAIKSLKSLRTLKSIRSIGTIRVDGVMVGSRAVLGHVQIRALFRMGINNVGKCFDG